MTILTYTPNPAIDAWASCEVVVATEKTRVSGVRYDPGGGGINVARVLHVFGTPAMAVYLAGGRTGPLLHDLLDGTGVDGVPIPIADDTRISHVVLERSTGREFRFVPEGPLVAPDEARAALRTLQERACSMIVASGSLPRGVGVDHYAEVARIARGKGIPFVLDTSGEALAAAVRAGGIDLLKASRGELAGLVGRALPERGDVAASAAALLAAHGIGRILVSLGPAGALLVTPGGVVDCPAQPVAVQGTVGAGDSFLAGYLHGTALGLGADGALALAVAAGSAACLRPGTQLAHPDDTSRLLPERAPRPDPGRPNGGGESKAHPEDRRPAMTQPTPFDLTGPAPATLAPAVEAWTASRRGEAPIPFADDLDRAAWPDIAALALVRVFVNPLRLRLEHVGATWSGRFGRTLEGRFLDEVANRDPLDMLEEQCKAAIAARRPTLSAAAGRPDRLVLPYWGDGHVALLAAVLAADASRPT